MSAKSTADGDESGKYNTEKPTDNQRLPGGSTGSNAGAVIAKCDSVRSRICSKSNYSIRVIATVK